MCECVQSPDSLWIIPSHGPHHGAAPVMTHQGDLWDPLGGAIIIDELSMGTRQPLR